MKIDVIASEVHYLRHLLPIWAKLPRHLQGVVHSLYAPGTALKPPMGRVALVAGWQDVAPLRGICPMIYVEHGAGQVYVDKDRHPSYSGGGERHIGVIGYIAPSDTVAARWSKPAAAVGCPKMDAWHEAPHKTIVGAPTVCFAWHWDTDLVPETRSALPHYDAALSTVVSLFKQQGWRVLGHAHPKWRGAIDEKMRDYGMEIAQSENDVFNEADVLFVDNSSLAYEFASLARPVVLLNAPWYRREIEHGLRFWEYPPGLEINEPDELAVFNLWDLVTPSTPLAQISEFRRTAAVAHAYTACDGKASERAVAFIESLLAEV